jgi:hypothetical protein
MAKLTFPARPNGLAVNVVIGLDGQTTTDLAVAGLPIAAPIELTGEVDTGSTVSNVPPWVLKQLGITNGIPATTMTANGPAVVMLYLVSITIHDPQQPGVPEFTLPTILATDLPDVGVLVGLDVLLQCNFLIEGPKRTFTFEF